jgi:hypothetical protein
MFVFKITHNKCSSIEMYLVNYGMMKVNEPHS